MYVCIVYLLYVYKYRYILLSCILYNTYYILNIIACMYACIVYICIRQKIKKTGLNVTPYKSRTRKDILDKKSFKLTLIQMLLYHYLTMYVCMYVLFLFPYVCMYCCISLCKYVCIYCCVVQCMYRCDVCLLELACVCLCKKKRIQAFSQVRWILRKPTFCAVSRKMYTHTYIHTCRYVTLA